MLARERRTGQLPPSASSRLHTQATTPRLPHPDYHTHTILQNPSYPPWHKSWFKSSGFIRTWTHKKPGNLQQIISAVTGPHNTTNYTDGSIDQLGRAGTACILPSSSARLKIHGPASTTHTELLAIRMALQLIHTPTSLGSIIVHTDSHSAIQGITSTSPSLLTNITNIIHNEADRLQCQIILNWVPSHIGIAGNEQVDQIAKSATTITYPSTTLQHTARSLATATSKDPIEAPNPTHYLIPVVQRPEPDHNRHQGSRKLVHASPKTNHPANHPHPGSPPDHPQG